MCFVVCLLFICFFLTLFRLFFFQMPIHFAWQMNLRSICYVQMLNMMVDAMIHKYKYNLHFIAICHGGLCPLIVHFNPMRIHLLAFYELFSFLFLLHTNKWMTIWQNKKNTNKQTHKMRKWNVFIWFSMLKMAFWCWQTSECALLIFIPKYWFTSHFMIHILSFKLNESLHIHYILHTVHIFAHRYCVLQNVDVHENLLFAIVHWIEVVHHQRNAILGCLFRIHETLYI